MSVCLLFGFARHGNIKEVWEKHGALISLFILHRWSKCHEIAESTMKLVSKVHEISLNGAERC